MEKPSFLSTSKTSGKSDAAQSSRQGARDPLGRAHDIAKRSLQRIGETMKRGRRDRRAAVAGLGDAASEQRPGSRTGERPIQRRPYTARRATDALGPARGRRRDRQPVPPN